MFAGILDHSPQKSAYDDIGGSIRAEANGIKMIVYPELVHYLKSLLAARLRMPQKKAAARALKHKLEYLVLPELQSQQDQIGGFRVECRAKGTLPSDVNTMMVEKGFPNPHQLLKALCPRADLQLYQISPLA